MKATMRAFCRYMVINRKEQHRYENSACSDISFSTGAIQYVKNIETGYEFSVIKVEV